MYRSFLPCVLLFAACGDDAEVVQPPELHDQALTTPEDTALQLDVVVTASDARSVVVTIVTPPAHGILSGAGPTWTYTPATDFHGTDSVVVRAEDGHGSAQATLQITVVPVDDAPIANADSFSAGFDTPLVIAQTTLLANDTDVDSAALTIVGVTPASGGSPALSGSNVVFTPTAGFKGTASFSYQISDGTSMSTASVAVTIGPDEAPVAVGDVATTDEDMTLTVLDSALMVNDTDAEHHTLAISAVGNATQGTITHDGTHVTFVPAPNFHGLASFEYTVTDGFETGTGTVAVTVRSINDAPVAVADVANTDEDIALALPAPALTANDSDVDGDVLIVTAVTATGETHGTVTLANDIVTYAPATNFQGIAAFAYTVSDNHGGTATAIVTITVAPLNDAPLAVADVLSTAEDASLAVAATMLASNDTDVDGDPITVTAVAATTTTHGTVSLATGVVTYRPTANYNGPADFTYSISDGQGGTATGSVAVAVTPVNDSPVANSDTRTTLEDTVLGFAASTLVANDADVDGDTLVVSAVTATATTHGTVSLSAGQVTYTPAPGYNGSADFGYSISDGQGGTASSSVLVTITAVNDAPLAVADVLSTAEDAPLAVAATALATNDTDVDGDPITATAVAATATTHGTVSLASGVVTYRPTANYNGPADFTYSISDGHGGTATGSVAVTVTPVNDSPVANSDTRTTLEETVLGFAASTLVANDTDIDGDTLVVSAVTATATTHGTVSLSAGQVTYTPALGYNGSADFGYSISDGQGGTASSSVVVTITAVNDAPVVVTSPGTATYVENALPVQIDPAILVSDDDSTTLAGATVQLTTCSSAQDILAVAATPGMTAVYAAATCTLTLTGAATPTVYQTALRAVTYASSSDAPTAGSRTARFTVDDGGLADNLGSDDRDVSVTPVDDAPVAVNDSRTMLEDAAATALSVLANDTDVDGGPKTISAITQPANGTVAIIGNGTDLTYIPNSEYCNTPTTRDSFTYTVSPGANVAMVAVTVTCVDDRRVAADDTATVAQDSTATTLFVLLNDTDADGGTTTIASITQPAHGVAALAADSLSVTYTPAAGYCNGVPNAPRDTFTYTLTPGGSSATVSMTITCTCGQNSSTDFVVGGI